MKHFKHIGGGVVLLFLLSLTCVAQTVDLWVDHPRTVNLGNSLSFYFGPSCPCSNVTTTVSENAPCDCQGSGTATITIQDSQGNTVFSQTYNCDDAQQETWGVCLQTGVTYSISVTTSSCGQGGGSVLLDRTTCCTP